MTSLTVSRIHALVSACVVIAYEWMTERSTGRLFPPAERYCVGLSHKGAQEAPVVAVSLHCSCRQATGSGFPPGQGTSGQNRETCWSIVLDAKSDRNLNNLDREPDIHVLVLLRVVIAYEWMTERCAGRLFPSAECYCVGLSTWGHRKPPRSPSAYTAAAGGQRGRAFMAKGLQDKLTDVLVNCVGR